MIRGGPSKAQSMTTMRPFSRRWAIVSAPLPIDVEVGDVWSSSTAQRADRALGRDVDVAVSASGAVPTKNSAWCAIHSRWRVVDAVVDLAHRASEASRAARGPASRRARAARGSRRAAAASTASSGRSPLTHTSPAPVCAKRTSGSPRFQRSSAWGSIWPASTTSACARSSPSRIATPTCRGQPAASTVSPHSWSATRRVSPSRAAR